MKRFSLGKFLMSIVLVSSGILLLLVNLEVISVEINKIIVLSIPILLILVGLKWFLEGVFSKTKSGSVFLGLISTIFGGLLLAGQFGYIEFNYDDVWKLWPLVLIYIGIKITSKPKHHKPKVKIDFESDGYKDPNEETASYKKEYKSSDISNVFSLVDDASFKEENWAVEPMNIHKGILDYDFDFTKAFIPDKETSISISGWVGDIKVRIPENIEFMVEGKANIGDVKIGKFAGDGLGKDLHYKTANYDEATRKLKFSINFKVLDLRIERV